MGIPKRNQPKDEAEKGRPSLRRVFIVGWWWRPRGRRSRVQRRGSLDPRRHVGPTSRADSTAVGAGGTRGGLWTACTEFSFSFSSFLLLPSRLAGLAGWFWTAPSLGGYDRWGPHEVLGGTRGQGRVETLATSRSLDASTSRGGKELMLFFFFFCAAISEESVV